MGDEGPEYQVFIDQRGGIFYAFTPDLPGCDATGSSEAEVWEAITAKIDRYLEALRSVGIEPPEPPDIRGALVRIQDGVVAEGIVADPEYKLLDLLTGSIKAKAEKSNAGRSPKRRKGIAAAIFARLSGNPRMTNREVWESFPESIDVAEEHFHADDGTEYLVYRDTPLGSFSPRSKLVQVNNRTGKESAITYRRFEAHLTEARNKLKKTPRTSTR